MTYTVATQDITQITDSQLQDEFYFMRQFAENCAEYGCGISSKETIKIRAIHNEILRRSISDSRSMTITYLLEDLAY
jgi:hypothetical protein